MCLLGAPALRVGGRVVPFTGERPYLLLALLACRRAWLRRDELADLLYPGRDLPAARSNLRKVLHLARQVEGAGDLEQQGDLLRWLPDSDLVRFESACGAQQWEPAVAQYGGPLLLGLDKAWPAEAAEWLHAERQRLHARWHEACTRRLAQLASEPQAASALAQAMLRADPLDDTALQALAAAQLALGQPGQALGLLHGYTERLAAEAGLQPSAAVRAWGDALQGRAAAPGRSADGDGPVGRRQELAQIAERLAEPGCRVLTLLGVPGCGKSTLARAALARHAGVAHGVTLEDLTHADQVPGRVAALLQLQGVADADPWSALAAALGPGERLLVLDNAEHLALAPGLSTLLAACPGLRVLVASRLPVGVAGEWRLPVAGLPLPDADETDPEVLRANDAVQLFERRAQPLAPDFDLAAEAADVVRLLHDVDGLPLAIELLAAWRRLMPVREILAELAESLDLLEPATPNERSVRASFARAWSQLAPLEQRALSQLAVLPGPLSRGQVRAVLQVPLPVIAALADRSLVSTSDDGLFTLHPLIRRCAQPLATDVPTLRERHARELAQRLAAEPTLPADRPHLLASWQWAVDHADAAVLLALAAPLRRQVHHRHDMATRWEQLAAARRALQPGATGTAERAVRPALTRLALLQGQLSYGQGLWARALDEARQARAWAHELGDAATEANALTTQSNIQWQLGHLEAALACIDEAIALNRAAGAAAPKASTLSDRALILKSLGRYEQARLSLEAALQTLRQDGKLRQGLYVPINLGNLLRNMGRGAAALELLHEALRISRTPGDPTDEPYVLTNIARVHETLGQVPDALQWVEQALRTMPERGEPAIEVGSLLLRARLLALQRPMPQQAWQDLAQALKLARRLGSAPTQVVCVASIGVVLARAGRRDTGLAFVRWAQRQSSFSRADREDAERQLAALNVDASEESAALRQLPPQTPLAEVLERLPLPAPG